VDFRGGVRGGGLSDEVVNWLIDCARLSAANSSAVPQSRKNTANEDLGDYCSVVEEGKRICGGKR